jgi:hypothetical protein
VRLVQHDPIPLDAVQHATARALRCLLRVLTLRCVARQGIGGCAVAVAVAVASASVAAKASATANTILAVAATLIPGEIRVVCKKPVSF